MKLVLHIGLALSLMLPQAWASHYLSFSNADGYAVEMDVVTIERGSSEDWYQWIGSVRAHLPGSNDRIDITNGVRVEAYEWGRRIILRYNGSDPRIPTFHLIVFDSRASLHFPDKAIHGEFTWLM